jgi:hypothetical protein
MKLTLLIIGVLIAGMLGVSMTGCFKGGNARDLKDKRLNERVPVDLAGVATVSLPPTFRPAGIVNSGDRRWSGGGTTPLEYHLDERRFTYRFLQGQHTVLGGYNADPVILDVTIFNTSAPPNELARLDYSTIGRVYAQNEDRSLSWIRWLPNSEAGAHLRSGEMTDHYDGKSPRLLVMYVDPERRTRVDLFTWTREYDLAEAQRLVREIAASAAPTPALQRHFDDIKTFDRRMEAQRDRLIASLATACGAAPLEPGKTTFGTNCVLYLTPTKRDVKLGAYLGDAPASAMVADGSAKVFPLEQWTYSDFPGEGGMVSGRPSLGLAFVSRDAAGKSSLGTLQAGLRDHREPPPELVDAIGARLSDRALVSLWLFEGYDLMFSPERVKPEEFLERARSYEAGLSSGRIITGVRTTKRPLAP